MVFTLKILRHYLYGKKCEAFTYYKSLKYLFEQMNLIMRQRRWLELISDYQCDIKYHHGKVNVVTDALSCKSKTEDSSSSSSVMGSLFKSMKRILIRDLS